MSLECYSHGKLLLTGEYVVLDGALSLAFPTGYGQSLEVIEIEDQQLIWESLDEKRAVWFNAIFEVTPEIEYRSPFKDKTVSPWQMATADMLLKILTEARKLNPQFLTSQKGLFIKTKLDFPRTWGLGSSSTLINNVAQWAQIDAYQLLQNTFGGSGYDIACAQHNRPILYALGAEGHNVEEVDFRPDFINRLYFVHLNKKQDSREGIARYRQLNFDKKGLVEKISKITQKITSCQSFPAFELLLLEHETLLSEVLHIPMVKAQLFPDFDGVIKSLGAWGGDFVLATGGENTPIYFKKKGYDTVIPYTKMVLS